MCTFRAPFRDDKGGQDREIFALGSKICFPATEFQIHPKVRSLEHCWLIYYDVSVWRLTTCNTFSSKTKRISFCLLSDLENISIV